jgi:hypothetical protein
MLEIEMCVFLYDTLMHHVIEPVASQPERLRRDANSVEIFRTRVSERDDVDGCEVHRDPRARSPAISAMVLGFTACIFLDCVHVDTEPRAS